MERLQQTSPLPPQPAQAQRRVGREPAAETPQPAADKPASSAAQEMDRLIAELLVCDREKAKAVVEELRLFHPHAVAERLAERFETANGVREKARAVWAAGELCERHGLAFLARCAQSEEYEVRRLAASALGKAARVARMAHAEDLAAARAALVRLLDDPAPQVRQYAQSSLEEIPPGKP